MSEERTFLMLKPDAVQRGLIGEIIKRFEQKGFKLVAMKMTKVGLLYLTVSHFIYFSVLKETEDHLKQHYIDLASKGFYAGLVKYMSSHPVVAMVD